MQNEFHDQTETENRANENNALGDSAERIAPLEPRGEETEVVEEDLQSQSVNQRSKIVAVVVAICVIVALIAGVGFASGWFGSNSASDNGQDQTVAASDQNANSSTNDNDGSENDSDEAADESDEATDGSDESSQDSASDKSDTKDQSGSSSGSTSAQGSSSDSSAGSSQSAGNQSGSSPASISNPSAGNAASTTNNASTPAPAPAQKTITVSVYIDSSRAAAKGWSTSCMANQSVTLTDGASVYDALVKTGVAVSGSRNYVSRISGLGEFDYGSGSGWLYAVNGVQPGYGCGSYKLHGGESIRWIYTCDLGKDV